jgi:hypothetical protein
MRRTPRHKAGLGTRSRIAAKLERIPTRYHRLPRRRLGLGCRRSRAARQEGEQARPQQPLRRPPSTRRSTSTCPGRPGRTRRTPCGDDQIAPPVVAGGITLLAAKCAAPPLLRADLWPVHPFTEIAVRIFLAPSAAGLRRTWGPVPLLLTGASVRLGCHSGMVSRIRPRLPAGGLPNVSPRHPRSARGTSGDRRERPDIARKINTKP